MNDSIGALLALGVLYLIFRCLCSRGGPNRSPNAAATATARARAVPDAQVAAVHAMFPQIPEVAIRDDLARSGSTQATADRILRDGSLPMPRTGLLPTNTAPTPTAPQDPAPATTTAATGASASTTAVPPDLLTRYGLAVSSVEGKGKSTAVDQAEAPDTTRVQPGWSNDRSEREQVLRKRKEAAILQARKYVLMPLLGQTQLGKKRVLTYVNNRRMLKKRQQTEKAGAATELDSAHASPSTSP